MLVWFHTNPLPALCRWDQSKHRFLSLSWHTRHELFLDSPTYQTGSTQVSPCPKFHVQDSLLLSPGVISLLVFLQPLLLFGVQAGPASHGSCSDPSLHEAAPSCSHLSPDPTFPPQFKHSLPANTHLPSQTGESWQPGWDWAGRVCGKAWDSHTLDNYLLHTTFPRAAQLCCCSLFSRLPLISHQCLKQKTHSAHPCLQSTATYSSIWDQQGFWWHQRMESQNAPGWKRCSKVIFCDLPPITRAIES